MLHTRQNPTKERGEKGSLPFLGEARLPAMGIFGSILLFASTLAGLWAASLYNYLLFHTIAEGFAIIIAYGVFMLAWNSRRVLDNNYLLLVGVAYAFIGAIDLVHTLAYQGMGVFVGYGPDLATQLWIGARYMEALTLLVAPLALTLRIRPRLMLLAYAGATALLITAVFGGVFPDCFVEGSGQTVFKVASEYVICGLLVTATVFLYLRRSAFEPGILYMLLASIGLTILSELSFTLYSDPYDFFNLMGHFFKLVSFYLLYRAVIVTGLARPYDLLYRRLNESERRYRTLFSNMTEAFALHEIITEEDGTPTDYRFIEVNPAFENLTGLEREEVVGRTVREVLPDTKDYWIDIYGKVALTGDPAHIENYSAKLDRWYEAFVYQTEPGRFAGLFTDITERKDIEKAMQESEQRLRMALDAAYVMSFEWDIQRNTVRRFVTHESALKRFAAGKVGTFEDVVDVVHPEDRELFKNKVAVALEREDGEYESEFRMLCPDGEIVWLYERGRVERDANRHPFRLLGLSQDITERKQAEEKIREMNRDLERRVAERTQQLQALTMELSDAENRERQRLSQMLHDELQQQLAVIKLRISSLVPKEEATPAVHKRIEDTISMVDDAIAESRSLSRELYPMALRMHGLFSALQQLSKNMNQKHGLELSLELAPEADVRSERIGAILYQAVRELLFNVVKHSGALEASVTACCADHEIRISVCDNGRGFDPEKMRGKAQQYTSLGLQSIEERIVYLGGRVEIESDPGKGCCVTLGLPAGIAKEELPAPGTEDEGVSASAARTVAATDAPESPPSGSIQILLVDDHDLMRESLASELAKESDFDVIGQASDGLEAVKLAIELAPDVVLMDVSMPDMTGIEATARIREQFPHAAVIGLTMYSDPATGDRMREVGAEEMLSKSGTIRQLCAAIREHGGSRAESGRTVDPADQHRF